MNVGRTNMQGIQSCIGCGEIPGTRRIDWFNRVGILRVWYFKF